MPIFVYSLILLLVYFVDLFIFVSAKTKKSVLKEIEKSKGGMLWDSCSMFCSLFHIEKQVSYLCYQLYEAVCNRLFLFLLFSIQVWNPLGLKPWMIHLRWAYKMCFYAYAWNFGKQWKDAQNNKKCIWKDESLLFLIMLICFCCFS